MIEKTAESPLITVEAGSRIIENQRHRGFCKSKLFVRGMKGCYCDEYWRVRH